MKLPALLFCLVSSCALAANQPNIVVILCDDLGYGDVKANSPACKIATPHMDRIAREGVRFTDAHTPSTVCSPPAMACSPAAITGAPSSSRACSAAFRRADRAGRETIARRC